MNESDQFGYGEKRTFFGRYGFVAGIAMVAVIGGILFSKMFSGQKSPPPRKAQEMVMIKPSLPPPPPPPPPPPQNEPKQQMMEQTPVDEQEVKPDDAPPDTSPAVGTNIQGNGAPDGFGLSSNGKGFLGGSNGGKSNGSRFGWYANMIVKELGEALRQNSHTRNASFNIKVRIWSDATGRIIRARLVEPTGDLEVDEAIKNSVLSGHQLKEAPPEGMPMPIVMRLTARRPD